MKKTLFCDVCGNSDLIEVLNLGEMPLCDDLIPIGSKKESKKYPAKILFCEKCTTAHHEWVVDRNILFPKDYHYRANVTESVKNSHKDLFLQVKEFLKIKNTMKVMDIGCNDGTLLSFFKEKGCQTIGIEPTNSFEEAKKNSDIVINEFFDSKLALKLKNQALLPDIITFTNVFAHIDDVEDLCKAINIISKENTLVVIENHYLGGISKTSSFDTFYHEHPKTYSINSFKYISKKLKKSILKVDFTKRDGSNIRIFIGETKKYKKYFKNDTNETYIKDNLLGIQRNVDNWVTRCKKLIIELKEKNNNKSIACKAFPGRATILINLLGSSKNDLSAAYEIKGSLKTGNYIPGSRIPILEEKDLYSSNYEGPILNLAWHLPKEVRENLRKNNFFNHVYDINSTKMMT